VIDKATAIAEGIFHHTFAKVELSARETECPVGPGSATRAIGIESLIPAHSWAAS
jgi:hypothetical protein